MSPSTTFSMSRIASAITSTPLVAAFSASAQGLRDSIVAKARGQIGTRYKLGGTKPNLALDCSGLVKYVMGALDVVLPRTAQKQSTVGREVPKDLAALKPGDLLTFGRGKRISHIGIYVFFSLYLDSLGYSKTMIGVLWAFGVACEVAFLWSLPVIERRTTPEGLILLGAGAAVAGG